MKAAVIYADNPFAPSARRVREIGRSAPISRLAPRTSRPTIALLNGTPIMREHRGWHRTRIQNNDQLVFVTLPLGGGGAGGSNPLNALLSIALMAFAGPLASAILPGAGGFLLAATKIGVVVAGQSLLNALLPAQGGGQAQLPSPSPTYSIGAQGNTARIGAPIPVQYGRMLAYPDFAALPYLEYAGQEQYLYQLLCLGCGSYDVEQIRIEDTPISSFEEITYEVVPPGSQVTLFPTAVISSPEASGQELRPMKTATWSRSGTTATITRTAHGYVPGEIVRLNFTTGGGPSGTYAIATVPNANTFTVTITASGTSGAVEVYRMVGGLTGFVASGAGQSANRLAVDIILPFGLYNGTDSDIADYSIFFVFEAQKVNDSGTPIGSWFTLESSPLTARTSTPLRYSRSYSLPSNGRYRVRGYRADVDPNSTYIGSQLLWGGLRAYLEEAQDFGQVTLIAMRLRATNNLSLQSSRKIAVISTRKLPIWSGSAWSSPVATRSPAWAIADAARDQNYGGKLADSKIDLDAILALNAVLSGRSDYLDCRFDQASTWWESVQAIASVGRAKCFFQGGKLRTVRDGAATVPVASFSMRSIKAGSFSVDYIMPSATTADAVDVEYFDGGTWVYRTVRAKLSGSSAANPKKLPKFGITGRAHALREGMYEVACNKYRRRIVRFNTEMEGFIPAFGDLISIQHDMAGWGQSAEVVGWDAGTKTVTLDNPVTVTGSTVIGLRRLDASVFGPVGVTAGATAYDLVLASSPDFTVAASAQDRESTHAMIGSVASWSTLAKVAEVKPLNQHEVQIEAIADDPSVHTADVGVTAPAIRTSSLPRSVIRPVVQNLFARRMPGDLSKVLIGWRPAPYAEIYNVEMAPGADPTSPSASWTRVGDTAAPHLVAPLLYAKRTMIRVRGNGLAAGPWISNTLGNLLPSFWNTDDAAFWTGDGNIFWSS